jgi:beta-glucosidase
MREITNLVKNELGLFENPFPNPDDVKNIGTDESHNFNRDATRETIVLVKNEKNILPLEKENLKILVTGPTANLLRVLNSGWSYGWQSDDEGAYTKYGKYNLTLFDAINNINKQKNVKFSEGANLTQLTNLAQTIEEAKNSDIIILGIGEDVYAETPGNIYDMNLPKHQFQLADALFELNKPVIVVYFGGRPRVFTRIAEKANAILIGFLPGPRGPEAISDILFGDYNPDGRLPVTYPKSRNGLFTYDYKNLESQQNTDFNCLYPFGHGLSYTTFEYSDLSFSTKNVKASEGLTVTVNVTNTGNRSGKHSVLLYLTDDYASVSRPNKQLKGFKKISLDPDSSQLVQFQLGQEDFSFPNLKNQKIYELGSFTVRVGNLTDSFDLVA